MWNKTYFLLPMKNTVHILSIGDLFPRTLPPGSLRGKIQCAVTGEPDIRARFSPAMFLNASTFLLVLAGDASIRINYNLYTLNARSAVLMSASHLFHFESCSAGFRCLWLLVSKEFTDETDSTDMIYRRIRYGVKLYNTPVVPLHENDAALLADRLASLDRAIDDSSHLYYRDVVLNRLFAFYLDLSNVIDRQTEWSEEKNPSRYESIIKSFIELLVVHYRKEHQVEFYASHIPVSAHYLSLIVKRITGQSVSDFIFEMLYSDARRLLAASGLSIQEIAALLNFSDQSSFGKFFKRRAGMSPADYRKLQR